MKKNIIALSVVAAISTTSFAADINKEMYNQIQALKAQVEALEKKMAEQQAVQTQKAEQVSTPVVDEKRIEKIEKKLDTVSKTATQAKTQNVDENNKAVIEKALKRTFSPEFLNRIDDIVIFNQLSKENIFAIIDILMKGVMKRLSNLGFSLELEEEAKNFIAEKGYDVQFGARPLYRAIQKYLEDPLAEFILQENPDAGTKLKAIMEKAKAAEGGENTPDAPPAAE